MFLSNVAVYRQRFYKDPHEYPEEDKPFAMVDKNFLKKVMHVSELKPQRGFAIFLPFGMMLFRHFWRRMEVGLLSFVVTSLGESCCNKIRVNRLSE